MTINRDNLIQQIRVLMNKTVTNGCTEPEALAALDKARAMMDAYEVTEADLQLTKAESAILRSEPPGSRDPHGIKFGLSAAVSKFCDCEIWRAPCGLEICGLPADVRFATWLLDTFGGVRAGRTRATSNRIPRSEERTALHHQWLCGWMLRTDP